MHYDNGKLCKIWNRIDLPFQNWHKEFNKFWPEHSKVWKICTFNWLILTKVYNFSAKKVQRSYVWFHLRSIKILKENWPVLPKVDMRNLANFHQSTWNSPNWDLDGILLSKNENVWLKIYRGVFCHDNERLCKIWWGIYFSVSNWHKEFEEFWPEHSKISKICTLMGCFWPMYIMFELKN